MKQKKSQKPHKKHIAIVISIIATIAIVVTICLMIAFRAETTLYSIHYYYKGNIVFYFDAKPNYILVEERSIIQCIKDPCEPNKVSESRIDYTPEYRAMFEDVFKDRTEKQIAITDDDMKSVLGDHNAAVLTQLFLHALSKSNPQN